MIFKLVFRRKDVELVKKLSANCHFYAFIIVA